MTQLANRNGTKKKKTVRVAMALTGVTAGAVAYTPAAPAEAATKNYQIQVSASHIYQLQICGSNQNNTWLCTPGYNVSSSGGHHHYWKNNWWWHGHIELWWNAHKSKSWNECNITTGDYYGWVGTSGQWVHLYASPAMTKC